MRYYKEAVLSLILICLVALIAVICLKPVPNRYRFVPEVSSVAEGLATTNIFRLQDTATGKTYEWLRVVFLPPNNKTGMSETVTMIDPVHNKTYTRFVKSVHPPKN